MTIWHSENPASQRTAWTAKAGTLGFCGVGDSLADPPDTQASDRD